MKTIKANISVLICVVITCVCPSPIAALAAKKDKETVRVG